MAEPFELTVAQATLRMKQRSLSPVELMQSLLARASALEDSLRVWVTLDEGAALAEAGRREAELERGRSLGPLHGIPVGVKDIYYTKGVKTTACSPIFADFVPEYDATSVTLLKRAGAIIMGKTVTTEFACTDPPPTRNPWNPAHTPGGSSSGSAVGVAARIFPAAMGSQTAGSVVRPASYNGVVGVKPTFGRISRYGVMPVAWSLDTLGYFARTVEDAAVLLNVLAGHDPNDASSSTATVQDYVGALGPRLSPPRIGLVRQLFERADQETRDHTEGVVDRLSDAGAPVEEVSMSMDLDDLLAAHKVIMAVEAASVHKDGFRDHHDDYGPQVRSLIEMGSLIPAVEYVRAQRVRRLFRVAAEDAARCFDVLLSPATPSPAPRDLSTTGDPVFQTPWTTCGFPAMTIPSGLSESGLPFGIQIASASFAERRLLAASQWCERVLDISLAPLEMA